MCFLYSAGASMKGEFEERLKKVIEEVQASPTPIILFMDEVHRLIGAGGADIADDIGNPTDLDSLAALGLDPNLFERIGYLLAVGAVCEMGADREVDLAVDHVLAALLGRELPSYQLEVLRVAQTLGAHQIDLDEVLED